MSLAILEELAAELYFRAQAAQSKEERAAIKGVQHSIERVLERHGEQKPKLAEARAQQRDWPWFTDLQAHAIKNGSTMHTEAAEHRAKRFCAGLKHRPTNRPVPGEIERGE